MCITASSEAVMSHRVDHSSGTRKVSLSNAQKKAIRGINGTCCEHEENVTRCARAGKHATFRGNREILSYNNFLSNVYVLRHVIKQQRSKKFYF